MKFIVITSPEFIPGEAFFSRRLFDCGLDILHLRKPGSSVTGCAQLLDALPAEVRRRIVTHDHFSLCGDYGLFGVHLNCRNPAVPSGLCPASVSASCHSVAEVRQRKTGCDYVFMSPVFDSISKRGYSAAYSDEALCRASSDGTIDSRVMALGGVSLGNIGALRRWGFGGAAFLGDVWRLSADEAAFTRHACDLRCSLDENI